MTTNAKSSRRLISVLAIISLVIVTLLIVSRVFSAYNQGQTTISDDKLQVVTSSTQLKDFVQNIGRDKVSVNSIFQPNVDPHDYQGTAADARSLAQADLIVINGLDLEQSLEGQLQTSRSEGKNIVIAAQAVTALEITEAESEGTSLDPHIWMSVPNAEKIVTLLAKELARVDPSNSNYYQENSKNYLAQLRDLDGYIRQSVDSVPKSQRKLVTNHEVLNYYAIEYGLTVIGAVIPSTSSDAQASARETAALIEEIRAEKVKVIFAEKSINPKLAEQIAEETGIKVEASLYADSLGIEGEAGASYIGMLRYNTDQIVNSLK